MPAARPSRKYGIATASLVGHAVLLALLVLHAPRLRMPEMASGPPEAVIPVLIMPRTPPPTAEPGARPAPVRLHRRPQRFVEDDLPVAPLIAPTPTAPADRPTPPSGPRTSTLPSAEDALAANARNALRSRLGCDSATLSRAEREACMDRFAAGGRDAPFTGLGVDRDKAAGLDAAAARRERDYRYQRGIKPSAPASGGLPWDTTRGPPSPAEALGNMAGSDNVAKKVPF